jgi:hypothetical protein
MANTRIRTVDFLPEIFRTATNRQFLSATLDQLVQDPKLKPTQGYIGRRVGPGVNPNDNYVLEPSKIRTDYQLEPGVVFLKPNTNTVESTVTYPGLIDSIKVKGGNTSRQDRLWESEYYSWDPFVDLDKFINFSQYYWLPGGPDSVDVFADPIPLTNDFTVTRNATNYEFSGVPGQNPTITLARQGTYEFNVQQTGHRFWIQAVPGISGTLPQTPNQSSREVLGVLNNGDDNGTITFNVPEKSAQNFYYTLADAGRVSFATDINFDQINNQYVSEFLSNYGGIDGVTDLDGRTVIFLGDAGWFFTGLYDSPGQPYDTVPFDETVEITLNSQKYSVWRITYVYDDPTNPYIKLTVDRPVNNLSKVLVEYGTEYSNIGFYKTASGVFERIPLITANLDVLYYQDQDNPALFGLIRLVDNPNTAPIVVQDESIPTVRLVNANINDNILTFSTALGGTLLPGMILSGGGVTDGTYLVSSLGDNTWLLNQTATGQPNTAQIVDIIGSRYYTSPNGVVFSNGLKIQFQGPTVPASYSGNTYYVEGVGSSIQLLPVEIFITPETYTRSTTVPYDSTPYDSTPYDDSLNAPLDTDYLTVNRASRDQNAWSRSNRWFHVDIINATAQYNGTVPFLDNEYRAKRPVIEFIPDLKLFDYGTEAIAPVNIIDFRETDALSNINGTIGYSIDGYAFADGTRVIFAADIDPEVRNKVYLVKFIQPSGSGVPIIDLQPADLNTPDQLYGQNTIITSGITQQGKCFWYNGVSWLPAQQKTSVNQAPLFDVFDGNGFSFSDRLVYPGTSFTGTKLFSYALGEGVTDKVIGQPLKYLTINNVGDIVFDNNLYIDQFTYVEDTITVTKQLGTGFIRQYYSRLEFDKLIGWSTAYTTVTSRQGFSFTYTGAPLVIDIPVKTDSTSVPVKVFVNAVFLTTNNYTYEVKSNNSTVITFINPPPLNSSIEVSVVSDVASPTGFYSVPLNLENNPLNNQVTTVTLGTVRNYYGSICQNLRTFSGIINGQNNTRDLGNLIPYGDTIIQNSAPVTLTALFANNSQYDFFRALEFSSKEYEKYKNLVMDAVVKNNFQNMTAAEVLDDCMTIINLGKNELSPFYFTDTVPSGETFQETNYTVTPITGNTFDTLYSYNFTEANYRAILIYLNGQQLLGNGIEYTVAVDGPRVTIDVPLAIGDIVTLREYTLTVGNFVPSTPSKLGLYPAYVPEIFLDDTYVDPTLVIRGHDGSITVAYHDIRDEVLLEFEKRIYNNLKLVGNPVPLVYEDVAPGEFRRTDYTQQEITEIMGVSFLAWVGANKLNYREQEYIASNQFTWNYSSCQSKIDGTELLGAWRGIYNYFYDTDAPNTRPWEMLGISEKPNWWEEQYGPAPYTSGNLVLWEDLEAGRVMDPTGSYIAEKYIRPGLTRVIPSDSEGALLSPFEVVVGEYDPNSFRKSWTVGDDGSVEASWQKSSAWPFAVMRLLALTKPAQFFTYFEDRDVYRFDPELDEFVYAGRSRSKQSVELEIYGQGAAKHSYVNFIVDYNKLQGRDSTAEVTEAMDWIDVRLCYRLASFSDKQYIKIFTEKSSPNSLNTSLLLPDESYQILLYKNPTIDTLVWSSIVIQKTELGYAVYGYSTTRPYFEILTSIPNGNYRTITVADKSVRVLNDYSDTVVQVPYGYEFIGINSVADFLMSYGACLTRQGMTFEDQDRGRILNWTQMVQEFIYWSQQGWAPGSLININPAANVLNILKPGLVAEPLSTVAPEDILLNQNKEPLQSQDYVVERFENDLTLRGINNSTFSYLSAKFTEFEHIIIIDNTSVFNDLIYDPTTGARQSRLLFTGYTTYDWNGSLDAQGFILNQDNVQEWSPNRSYTKGQIVKYKDSYWSAVKIIPPSEKFDFEFWLKSDYAQIQKGLLPNAATKAQQIRGFYDTNQANLERDADLFAFGLIGFRPRQYMQNLNLDDISQVNLYSQFLGVKGTTQATDVFTKANLGKEVAEYEIFENWAIQRAIYGANANRSYYELRLNEAKLLGNPSTIEIIEPQEFSEANQTVQVSEIWKQSYPITNSDILPTTFLNATDIQLPSAGYVNWDDADIKLFNFTDLDAIINDIENIYVGTSVWVAKDNAYDWNIYRNNLVIYSLVQVRDNLNGTCTLQFNGQHGLAVNQKIVVKYFGQGVDGAYTVISTPSLTTATVALTLGGAVTQLTGTGVCFVLETMRVRQAADVSNLIYANSLLPGNRAWVDDDGTGHWVVYEKINPFTTTPGITPSEPVISSRFGAAITQGYGGLAALVGAPGYNGEVGAVYTFTKGGTVDYVETGVLTMGAANFVNYGAAVTSGGNQWGAIGAANSWAKQGYAATVNRNVNSGDFIQSQLLTEIPYRLYQTTGNGATSTYTPTGVSLAVPDAVSVVISDVVKVRGTDWNIAGSTVVFTTPPAVGSQINIFNYDEYGYSVAISNDERWLYVGTPAGNRVYAYNRVDVQSQVKNFIGDGETTDFYIADVIIVDDDSAAGGIGAQQIGVTVNDLPKTAGVDYDYANGTVVFAAPPNGDDEIRVIRLQSKTFFPTTPTTAFPIEDLYTVTDIYSFSVYVNSVLQRPNMDYSFNPATKVITFVLAGQTGTILVNSGTYFQYVDYIDGTALGAIAGSRFGHSVSSTTDGRQVVIGAPDDTADSKLLAGKVYIVDRSVERFTVTSTSQTQYSTLRTFNGAPSVKVNATYLIPDGFNNNGQFVQVDTNTVDIQIPLNVGDVIEIDTNTFALMESAMSDEPTAGANFGSVAQQCPTNCSLYIGQPNDSRVVPEGGSVERFINQARLYGLITSDNQNPTLVPGNTVRIQQVDVEVSTPGSWNSSISWTAGTFVISGLAIYQAIRNVPVSTSINDTSYWKPSSWVELFANDINLAAEPNNIGLVEVPNVQAIANDGYLTLTIRNSDAAVPFTQLTVLPGIGNAYYDLGFTPQVYAQTVEAPNQLAYAHFGASLSISDDSLTLVVGSPQGTAAKPTTFDNGTTFFDSKSTNFFDLLPESGVAYTYDLLSAANASVNNPSKFVFGAQIYDEDVNSLDNFGTAVSYFNGILLIGSPQDDLGDSVGDYGRISQLNNPTRLAAWDVIYRQKPIVDVKLINSVYMYDRLESKVTQYFDFIDPLQGKILGVARQNIDYIGAIDPAAYNVGTVNNYGDTWIESHLGEIWWDLSTVRFIDYHQSTIAYESQRWSQVFPGSRVDAYQWIESPVPPAEYSGPGTVFSTTSFVVGSKLNNDGLFTSRYYFWVRGISEVATRVGKTLSTQAISQYIENPRSSGLPYVAFLGPSTTAIYNGRSYISAQDTIFHVEFDKIANDDNVHSEYDLIASNNPNSFLVPGLFRKMLDSFCGEDTLGNKVPDTTLSPADRYGVQFRPRQSFFVDRFLALQNYLQRANAIMAQFSVSDSRPFNLLNSSEPEPTSASGEWNKRVLTYQELTFQDLSEVPVGYKYLVATDATNDGLWTIYTVILSLDGIRKELLLSRVQNYDTRLYWEYIDWIKPGYNATVRPVAEVTTFSELSRLTVPEGTSAKVTRNSFGKFEIYQYLNGVWDRVVLQDGTVRIKEEVWNYELGRFGFDVETFDSQRFDQYPAIETRQIIRAINEEILVDEWAIFRNELLLLVFDFILTEQLAPDWLFKTSLIDVNHKIRDLLPYQIFRTDNQDFVIDYIKEVKPYHVKIKEFNLRYDGFDTYDGNVTDFDCPPYYDTSLQEFEAPALDDSVPPKYSNSEPSTAAIWQEIPWQQWYENYKLLLTGTTIIDQGLGYSVPPVVIVTGDAAREARLVARVNTAGQVVELIVIDPGSGYTTTPIISIEGGNGVGAKAVAVLESQLVRTFTTTLKYDRYNYTSQVVDWQPNTKYTEGQLVRFRDQVYSVNLVDDSTELDSGPIFNPAQYTLVDQATLDAVDRVIGLYTPTPNEPGRELAQVMVGIDYPGVQVMGPNFNQNTGFDVGNFDVNPYDNIDYGPEGRPTYSESILDAIYESSFTDTYLGTRTTDINVDGGAFIDTYSSHAPEELVPGSTFDTLDFRVYTRPGADWQGDGHGFNIKEINLLYSSTDDTVDFSEVMAHAVAVRAVNVTNRVSLVPEVDYTVDWPNRTVTILPGAASSFDDIIAVNVYGIGGGSQLFKESYPGAVVGNSLTIPVITAVPWTTFTVYAQGSYIRFNGNVYRVNRTSNSGSSFDFLLYTIIDANSVLEELLILVNGEIISNYTSAPINGYETRITFADTYDSTDWVVVTAFGPTQPQKFWSFPVTQYIVYDGSTTDYTLDNSLQGTNPIDMIVERQGQRLRPAESIEYFGDGSSIGPFYLPTRGGTPQGLIADNDVVVYIDGVLYNLSVDYTVSPWDGSSDRYVEFATPPELGSTIKIAVTTDADYLVNGDQLILRVGAATGAVLAITTWNDTSEQGLLTQVFQGPTQSGVSVGQPYDDTTFDEGNVTGDPGSFDYGTGTVVSSNDFDTGRPITDSGRLWVTLDGWRLVAGEDYTVLGSVVTIGGSIIGPGQVVAITSFTQSAVPEAISFRIFQDMLGNQRIYRITTDNSTVLTQPLSETGDVIHVLNANDLSQPNPANNIFGQVTINGERITYRNRDVINNTVSGLRRGTAGTAVDSHAVASVAIDIGLGELLPARYQKKTLSSIALGDGATQTYTTDIGYVNEIDVYLGGSVRCYLGPTIGTLVEIPQDDFTIISVNPITVQLDFIPAAGLVFQLAYLPTVGSPSVLTVPTTGSTSRWAASFSATDLVLQSENDYTITNLNPITVEFDTPVPVKRVVVINDLNSNSFFISQADIATTTFVTDISVTRPVQVKVGGTLVSDTTYSVSSVNPIVVTFNTAPANGVEVEIYIQQALVMYAQGIGTASNGRPLQEQPTLAAWFIEGRV